MAEQDHPSDLAAAKDWGTKALAASGCTDALRATGNTVDADKFDNLAKVALGKQIGFENEAKDAEPMIASQNEVVEALKTGLAGMKDKLSDLKQRRDSLVAQAKNAQAPSEVQHAVSSITMLDPTSEVSRFEEKVRREERAWPARPRSRTPPWTPSRGPRERRGRCRHRRPPGCI